MNPVVLVILAPFVGSFLGVLVRRLPRGESVMFPRSHCEGCGRALGAAELVPIASFLVQRGRCRGCARAIDPAHLRIELASTLVPAVALAALPLAGLAPVACASVLGWVLLALAWIDARHWILPDVLTLPLLLAGLGATWWLSPWLLLEHAVAAVAAFVLLACFALAYEKLRGREGLGLGDAKLLAVAGAWTGAFALPWVLFGAAVLGLAVAAARHGRSLAATSAIPFGPPLCAAIWVAYLCGLRLGA